MKRALIMVALLALVPAAADAGTITLYNYKGIQARYTYEGQTTKTEVGAFRAEVDIPGMTDQRFDAYCVELTDTIQVNPDKKYKAHGNHMSAWDLAGGTPSQRGEKAAYLYSTFYSDALGDDGNRAALQLAIWNVLYDRDFTLDSGRFSADWSARWFGAANYAINQGNYYLGLLHNAGRDAWKAADATWLEISHVATRDGIEFVALDQDLIAPPPEPVPEPGSMLLLGSGLVGLVGAARRRARR